MQKERMTFEKAKRRRQRMRWINNNKSYIVAAVVFLLVTTSVVVLASNIGEKEKQQEQTTEESQTTEKATESLTAGLTIQQETEHRTIEPQIEYPFNLMSHDWDGESLQGFRYYEVPEEFVKYGGYMPDCFQKFTYIVCNNNGVDYALVLAIIEVESGYRWNAESAEGSQGYMQVNVKWHEDRMERMGIDNVKNPYFNIMVAVDFLKELQGRFETEEKVLTAYNYGVTGAYKHVWNYGLTETEHSRKVQAAKARIKEQIGGEEE